MKTTMLEGISDIVYHFTSLPNAYKIINNQRFRMSPSFANSSEESYSKDIYYLSTTRSRLGHYHQSSNQGVLFELDGRALRNRNKGSAINYWHTLPDANKHEFEDRVYSTSPYLSASNVILGIEVVHSSIEHTTLNMIVKFIYLHCKKNNIKCKIYHSMEGLRKRDRKDLFTHSEILELVQEDKPDHSPSFSDKSSYKSRMNPSRSNLYNFIQTYYKKYDDLNEHERQIYREIVSSSDIISKLQAEVKSSSTYPSSSKDTNYIHRIGEIIKKEKVNTLTELIKKLRARYQKEDKIRNDKHRQEIMWRNYYKNEELYSNVLNSLMGKESFNRDMLPDRDEIVMMKIDRAVQDLATMGLIPKDVYHKWIDQYGVLTDEAWTDVFKMDI